MRTRGFTLLELSIVLVIIALVTGMAVTAGVSVVETARLTATQKKMKAIETALMQYRTANDRVPCPSDLTLAPGSANYGLEAGAGAGSAIATGTGVCTGAGMLPQANFTGAGATNTFQTAAEGAVPAVTLGLSPDFMIDGWGNQFRYAVDISYTGPAAFAINGVRCTNGAITINDSNGNARSTGSVYALISHGANGHGAYTRNGVVQNAGSMNANELINCHCNSSATATTYAPTYVQMQQTLDPNNSLDNFDDLVTHKQRWQMQTTWDKVNGCNYLYASDYWDNRVEIFTTNFTYVGQVGCASGACAGGTGNGKLNGPMNVALDTSGNLWVIDFNDDMLNEFSPSGAFITQYGGYGQSNGQFWGPSDLYIDSSNNIWVVDAYNNRVEKFDKNFNFLMGIGSGYLGAPGTVGTAGSGNQQINTYDSGSGISLDSSGNIWLADWGNNRVVKYSSSGTYISQIGCSSGACANNLSGNGQFYAPGALRFDNTGNLWVEDMRNARLEEFDGNGNYLNAIINGNGGALDYWAGGIAFDGLGNVWLGGNANISVGAVIKFSTASGTFGNFVGYGPSGSGNGQFANSQSQYMAIGGR